MQSFSTNYSWIESIGADCCAKIFEFPFPFLFSFLLAQIQRRSLACLARRQVVEYSDLNPKGRRFKAILYHIFQRCRKLPELRWIAKEPIEEYYQHSFTNQEIIGILETCPKLLGFEWMLFSSFARRHAPLLQQLQWISILIDDADSSSGIFSLPNVEYLSIANYSTQEQLPIHYQAPKLKYLFYHSFFDTMINISKQTVTHLCWTFPPCTRSSFEEVLSSFPCLSSCEFILTVCGDLKCELFTPNRIHVWDFLKSVAYTVTFTFLFNNPKDLARLTIPSGCNTRNIDISHTFPKRRFVELAHAEFRIT